MEIEEFRAQARSALEDTLNKLQAATLLVTELETQISEAGDTIKALTQMVEQFINAQAADVPSQPTQPSSLEDGTALE
ncbi:MAG: hypothetical protein IGS48_22555 [Oscillatoriales cyanobacterium C42_A2020_001]|nr:hypothetical protein [Leptolyngbyaceae cyanobacterium C42_A2020_001]